MSSSLGFMITDFKEQQNMLKFKTNNTNTTMKLWFVDGVLN